MATGFVVFLELAPSLMGNIDIYMLLPTYKGVRNKIYKSRLSRHLGPWRLTLPTGGIRGGTGSWHLFSVLLGG